MSTGIIVKLSAILPTIHWYHYSMLIGIVGLIMLLITPPYQVPDEADHFNRAFQLSQGQIIGVKTQVSSGGYLPKIVPIQASHFSNMPFKPEVKLTWEQIQNEYIQSPTLDAQSLSDQEFVSFPYMVLYSPIPYIASTTAILIGKIFALKLLTSLYLARLLTFFISLAIISYTFYLVEKWHQSRLLLFFLLAATPMNIFQLASVSADSMTNSLAFLLCALIITLEKKWQQSVFKIFIITAVFISFCKSFYSFLPLMLIPIILFRQKPLNIQQKCLYLIMIGFAIVLPNLLWLKLVSPIYTSGHAGADATLQLSFYLSHFWTVNQLIVDNFIQKSVFYQHSFIGILGWLDTYIHPQINRYYLRFLFLIAMTGITTSDHYKHIPSQVKTNALDKLNNYLKLSLNNLKIYLTTQYTLFKMVFVIVMLAIGFYMINVSQFLAWVPVGTLIIDGVQGRYYIPLAIFFFTALPMIFRFSRPVYQLINTAAVSLWVFVMIHTIMIMAERFWQ